MRQKVWQSPKILIVLLVLMVFSSFWFFQGWQKNKKVNQEIEELKRELAILGKDAIEMEELIAYFNSQSFIEQKAREDLGLKNPGEGVIVIVDNQNKENTLVPQIAEEPEKKSNFLKWWNYLFN